MDPGEGMGAAQLGPASGAGAGAAGTGRELGYDPEDVRQLAALEGAAAARNGQAPMDDCCEDGVEGEGPLAERAGAVGMQLGVDAQASAVAGTALGA